MAMITPTVDSVGDVALTNSIIDKSITEIQDDLVADIREHAFYNCTALKKAVFGSVSDVDDRAFDGCTALTTVDFHTSTPFGDYVFNNCSALTALILRGATVCHAISGTLQNSGIASGNGYVYVPAALVDAYKAASNWKTYAAQIRAIEDYPEVCDPYSWTAVSKAIEAGTYKDVYKIGDMVPVDLGSEGIINMQIAAFDADTLEDGSGTAAISWVGKELLEKTTVSMDNIDGSKLPQSWSLSRVKEYLQNTVVPLIPSDVVGMIQSVLKTHRIINESSTSIAQTTEEKVWIPGRDEVYTSGGIYTQIFADNESRKKTRKGTNAEWWLRDAQSSGYYYYVVPAGRVTSQTKGKLYAICLGFCTGRTPA